MATARRAKQPQQYPTWLPALLSTIGALAGIVVVAFGYPGVALTWLVMTLAAWTAVPAQFSGKKDASGFPTAAHPGETKAMQRYRFWADLKWHLIFPTSTLLPGWPPYAAWFYGLWASAVMWCLPYAEHGPALLNDVFRFTDAVLAFILVSQTAAARRRTVVAGDTSPGVRVDAITKVKGASRKTLLLGGTVTAMATAAAAWFAGTAIPAPPLPFGADVAWYVLGGIGGFGAGVAWWWVKASLTEWRILTAARAEWAPRWQMLKHDPAPFMVSREKVGNATIDTFDAPGSMGAMAYWPLAAKITPTMGAGQRIAVMSAPNTDSQGQPQPGTRHPLRFQIVYWPADAVPNAMDPASDQAEVELLIQAAMIWSCDASGYARPILDEATPIALTTAPATPVAAEVEEDNDEDAAPEAPQVSISQAWAVTWLLPEGPPVKYLRTVLGGDIAGHLGAQVLVDHRHNGGQGVMYIGDLTSGSTVFDPSMGVTHDAMLALATEDEWNSRWGEVLKQDVNPPTIEHSTYAEAALANGKTVHRQAFVTLRGVDPMDFWGQEAKIAATLDAAPFVAVCGWSTRGRLGERHPQAFTVYWSSDAVPANPDTLAPTGDREEQAAKWVLSGRLNQAFKAARLAAPEIDKVKCLTDKRSREHIWRMTVRLYGGVTLSDVRGASQRLRQSLGSQWLRVEAAPDGCVIVAGAAPSKVKLTNPSRDERYLAGLDWEQAYLDAKVVGVGGLTPGLSAVDRLPRNDQVQVLDFTLPSGLSFAEVKGKTKALETASRNAFVNVRRHPSGKADEFRILASEVNPMPESVPFDYVEAETSDHKIPFSTNLFGEPTCYDNKTDPMLLVVGAAGGGKAQPLDSRLPVPVSEKFPTGWATVGELAKGDLVYTPRGTTTPVTALTPVRPETLYRIHTSDGQVIEAGGHHLWKVSTSRTRETHSPSRSVARTAEHEKNVTRANEVRTVAEKVGPNAALMLPEIAALLGLHSTALHQMNLPLEHLGVAAQFPTGRRARLYNVAQFADHFDAQIARAHERGGRYVLAGYTIERRHVAGLREAGARMGGYLTHRAVGDALLGKMTEKHERESFRQIAARQKFEHRTGRSTQTFNVYPVDEVLSLVADRYESAASRARSAVLAREQILNTEELLAAGVARSGFGIELAAPIGGPDVGLLLDPYVLGAWLGDGTRRTGAITAEDREIIDYVIAAGYPVRRVEERSDQGAASTYHFDGLWADLRAAGVAGTERHPVAKHIPAVYLRASYAQRLALLQGLMDTDGTIAADGGCELSLADRRLAADALELIRSLGVKASWSTGPATIPRPDGTLDVIGVRHRIRFTTCTQVFRLPRKAIRTKAETRSTQGLLCITDVEVLGEVPMRCIGVADREHVYLTEHFVATHNSVALQNIIYGAVTRGWDLWVADPAKGGVDFQFSEAYSRAFARSLWESKGMVEAIYAEVQARKAINAQYNCGNYRDLPDEVRYNHVLIVLDEFTSMMMPEPVPKAMDDSPETLQAVEAVKAINAARAYIGTFVGKIVREARSTGFTMLLATQALKAETLQRIPGANDLKDNMSRMIMGRASFGQLQAALKMPTEAPEQPEYLPPGRGMYEGNGRAAEIVQVWFEGSQATFAQHLAEYVQPVPESRRIDLSVFVEPTLEVDGMRIDEIHDITSLPHPTAQVAPDQVVELDSFELSLDDLELSLEDLEGVDDDPDGPAPSDGDDVDVAVETSIIWDEIDPAAWEPETSAYGWTEIDALLGFLDQFPHVTDVSWTSTDLMPHIDTVTTLLTARAVRLHTGSPEATPEDGQGPPDAPVFDWDVAEAEAATAPQGVEAEPDWDIPTAVTVEAELAPEDMVEVDSHCLWDEIDPTPWQPEDSAFGWTEIDALMGFLNDFTHISEVTWTDAHLFDEDDMGITFADIVTDLLVSRGITLNTVEAPTEQPALAPVTEPNLNEFDFSPIPSTPPSSPAPAAQSRTDDRFEDFDFETPVRPTTRPAADEFDEF